MTIVRCALLCGVAMSALSLPIDASIAQGVSPQNVAGADADASSAIQDIVVTARRREESQQQTPLSITAVTTKALEIANVQRSSDLGRIAPNVVTSENAALGTGFNIFIRGIGASESSLAVDQAVGSYRDGIYLGHTTVGGNTQFTAIDHVEVLRGPQGTLFGRNTTGGAVNFVTRAPSQDFGAEQSGRYGRYNELESTTTVDTGELAKSGIAILGSYDYHRRDGIVNDPSRASSKDPGAYQSSSIFLKAEGQWGGLKIDYIFDHVHETNYQSALQLVTATPTVTAYLAQSPNLFGGATQPISATRLGTIDFRDLPPEKVISWGHALIAQYKFSDALTLKTLSSWRRFKAPTLPFTLGVSNLIDQTTSGVKAIDLFSYNDASPHNRFQTSKLFTEELQALGTIGDFDYTIGGFYLKESGQDYNFSDLTAVISPTTGFVTTSVTSYQIHNESKAAYGQASYKPGFLPGLELTGGLRYSEDNKGVTALAITGIAPGAVFNSPTFKNTTYAVSLSYHWTPSIMTFVRYGTGVRSGGYNIRTTDGAGNIPLFKPERANSVEGGVKADFLNHHLRINAGLFYTDYKDLQVSSLSRTATGASGGQTFNSNAHYSGGELEAILVPVTGLTLSGTLGIVRPKYDSFFIQIPPATAPVNIASTAKFPFLAKTNANAAINYEFPEFDAGKLSVNVHYSYVSSRAFNPTTLLNPLSDAIIAPGYGLFGARLSLADIKLGQVKGEVSLWVENLANKEYRILGLDFGALGYAAVGYGTPRTMGVDFRVKI